MNRPARVLVLVALIEEAGPFVECIFARDVDASDSSPGDQFALVAE